METSKIKFRGLSWVIELHFKSLEEAKTFLEREGMSIKIADEQKTAIIRIED